MKSDIGNEQNHIHVDMCNVRLVRSATRVQKRCLCVVVQCEAGPVKSKIYGEPVANCLENPLVPSLEKYLCPQSFHATLSPPQMKNMSNKYLLCRLLLIEENFYIL